MSESTHAIVFYDGGCGLCHRAVRFLLSRDPDGELFVFAPLGGSTFTSRLDESTRQGLPDSIVVITPDGRLFVRSDAALGLLRMLGGGWKFLARLLGILPASVLDRVYDFIASVRFRLFARPTDACPVLPPKLRARFLP